MPINGTGGGAEVTYMPIYGGLRYYLLVTINQIKKITCHILQWSHVILVIKMVAISLLISLNPNPSFLIHVERICEVILSVYMVSTHNTSYTDHSN